MTGERDWFPFRPELGQHAESFKAFARRLAADEGTRILRAELERELGLAKNGELPLQMVQSVALDLAEQGWTFSVDNDGVSCSAPSAAEECSTAAKERVRQGHAWERLAHLREASVREFLRSMEQRRLTATGCTRSTH